MLPGLFDGVPVFLRVVPAAQQAFLFWINQAAPTMASAPGVGGWGCGGGRGIGGEGCVSMLLWVFCALMTLVFQDFSRFAPEARIAIVGESSEGPRQLVVDSSLGSGASRSRVASLAAGESVNEVKSSHIRLSSEGADCLCLRHACVLMLLSVNVFGCVFRLLLLQNQ